jgi:carbamoyltransferase
MIYILGINSAYHESSACLLKDGNIEAFAEEERFNRIKHAKPAKFDNSDELPANAINFCLAQANILFSDIDYIGFSFDPESRLKKNVGVGKPEGLAENSWAPRLGKKFFMKKILLFPINCLKWLILIFLTNFTFCLITYAMLQVLFLYLLLKMQQS